LDLQSIAKVRKEIPQEILENRDVNAYLLQEQLNSSNDIFEKYTDEKNEYL
jgi:hypothetical protein